MWYIILFKYTVFQYKLHYPHIRYIIPTEGIEFP